MAEATRRRDAPLTIASYNIHRCWGVDRVRDPERVATVIREIGADIVALQEVEASAGREGGLAALAHLAEVTGLVALPGLPLLWDHRGDYGNAILTRYPVREVRHIDLSVPRCEPRGAVDAEIDLGDLVVRVVATHLGLRAPERQLQLDRLFRAVADRSESSLLVLLGDFNEWLPRSPRLRMLRGRFGSPEAPRTFPSWRPMFALDRIWAEPGAFLGDVRAHRSTLSRVASDHLPVVGTL